MKPRFNVGDRVRTRNTIGIKIDDGRIIDRLPPPDDGWGDGTNDWWYKVRSIAPKICAVAGAPFEMPESYLEAIADDWASEEPL